MVVAILMVVTILRVVVITITVVAVIVCVFILLEVEKLPEIAHHASLLVVTLLLILACLSFRFPSFASFSWIFSRCSLLKLGILTSILGSLTLLLLSRLALLWLIRVARWSIGRIRLVLLFLLLLLRSGSLFLLSQLWSLCVLTVLRG